MPRRRMVLLNGALVCAVALAGCAAHARPVATQEPAATPPPPATTTPPPLTTTAVSTHPAFSQLGLAMKQPGDRLLQPVDTFGTLHFEPPPGGDVPTIGRAAALAAVPTDLMPGKDQDAYVKLASLVDAKGDRLVWLIVEPSRPGAQPTGAVTPGQSEADKTRAAEYYANWPVDVIAMVDASTGTLVSGVMYYGVT